MHSNKEMMPFYNTVMDILLNRTPYGEFFAYEKIFGTEVANRVAEKGVIACPHHRRVKDIQRKENEDSDSEVEILEFVGRQRA
jgi:hypothetical protein